MNPTKQQMIDATRFGLHMLEANFRAIPSDQFDWSPGGKATSALQILKHCAAFPYWSMACIEAGQMVSEDLFSEHEAQITDMESGLAKLKEANAAFEAFVQALPDERLGDKVVFPWQETTVAGTIMYFDWNNTYHLGQLAYIQLILGDTEMHA